MEPNVQKIPNAIPLIQKPVAVSTLDEFKEFVDFEMKIYEELLKMK